MIEAFKCRRARKVRGTDIEAGSTLYAVKKGDLYFAWSYSDRAFAELIDDKVSPEGDRNMIANWRKSPHETTPSDRKSFG